MEGGPGQVRVDGRDRVRWHADLEVPDVGGESEDNARSAIEGAGLRVGKVTEQESEEDPGTVLSQSPAAGKRVAKNSAVALTIAKGVEIPDVVDETEDDATKTLVPGSEKVIMQWDQSVFSCCHEGASAAWLQVEEGNAGARALYAGMGFAAHHAYHHYREPAGEASHGRTPGAS